MTAVVGYSNQIDAASLSGGSWNASYPLTNLKNRYLAQRARSTNATTGATVIDIDLGSAQSIGLVALVAHNLSAAATVRIQGSSSASQTPSLYDSTAETIYTGGTDYAKTFTAVSARYWRISINDTGNTAGYVEIGRIFIGLRFKPATTNIDWGESLGIQSRSNVQESISGHEFFEQRPSRRVWTAKWSWLTDSEALISLHTIMDAMDVYYEVYLIADDTDTSYRAQRNFLGRFRQLSPIEYPYLSVHACGVEISELL